MSKVLLIEGLLRAIVEDSHVPSNRILFYESILIL